MFYRKRDSVWRRHKEYVARCRFFLATFERLLIELNPPNARYARFPPRRLLPGCLSLRSVLLYWQISVCVARSVCVCHPPPHPLCVCLLYA